MSCPRADAVKERRVQAAIALALLVLILLCGLPACGEQIEPTATAEPEPKKKTPGPDETGLPFETVFHDTWPQFLEAYPDLEYYKKREPALFVVTRHEDMESVESWLLEGPLLAIDYAQYLVVAVFQGYSSYTIPFAEGDLAFVTIEHVTSTDGVVNIYASVPTKTSEEQLCAVQSPYHVVQVDRGGLPTGQSIVFRLIVNGDVLARQRKRLPYVTPEPEPKKKTLGPDETGLPFETVFRDAWPQFSTAHLYLQHYKKREPALFVIAHPEDVTNVKTWFPGEPLLAIDYDQYLVVVVFQGYSGHTAPFAEGVQAYVTIEHVTAKDGVVSIYASIPTETSETPQTAVKSPYHVVQVDKDGLTENEITMFELIVNGESIGTYQCDAQ